MKTMKRNLIVIYSLAIVTIVAAASCSKKSDLTPPAIDVKLPSDQAEVIIGSPMKLQMTLTSKSNVNLKSYKVNIHSNFDNHTHQSIMNVNSKGKSEEKVIFDKIFTIDGDKKEVSIDTTIAIPNAAVGKYHMLIFCTDKLGNESKVLKNLNLKQKN